MNSTMNSAMSYVPSVILATALHALVIAALMIKWDTSEPIEVTRDEPYYIDATVVAENPFTARARKEKAAKDQARRQRQINEKNAAAQARARLEEENLAKARQEKLERERLERERQQALVESEPVAEEVSQEERLRMEQSLALAVLDELEYRRAVTDDEKAMAYVSQIKRDIVQNWSRPPSARNGMQALLKVRLVPTGEVVDVAVMDSSGNEAFDRSAIQAVEKAERFVVPADPRQFERNFREFEVLFRPEDLRL